MKKETLRIVFRVEFNTLTDNGKEINPRKFDRFARLVANLRNSGEDVIIVSSGAIALGLKKCNEKKKLINENSLSDLQAIAAIGQAELIREYQRYFDEYNQIVAQVLYVSDINGNQERIENAKNTFNMLLKMNIIPVVNENDAVSTIDIELNDNYPLAVRIAEITSSDIIIIKLEKENEYLLITRGSNQVTHIKNETALYEAIKNLKKHSINEGKFPSTIKEVESMIV